MNGWNTFLYKNISLIFFSKRADSLLLVWEIDGETYTQRRDFFLSHIFFREPGGANVCNPLVSHVIREVRDASDQLRVPGLTPNSLFCLNMTTWLSRGLLPVGPVCSDALSSPCLQITTWQLDKAHGITRNELKIHVICYITHIPHSNFDEKILFGSTMHCFIFLDYVVTQIFTSQIIPNFLKDSEYLCHLLWNKIIICDNGW